MAVGHRNSLLSGGNSRPTSKDGAKKNIWLSMLENPASGKKLPEKNILVLGGTPETQQDFLGTLSSDPNNAQLSTEKWKSKAPPIANQFALGYTYQDVLDADGEDVLARISVYLLSEPSPAFAPLLNPLLKPKSIPDTLIVILLDWSNPWTWIRELREWVRLLRQVLISLDDDVKEIMEETMGEWKDRKRGAEGPVASAGGAAATIPLGPGEWDEGLGLPLCVVCQKADKIQTLEKENGWRDDEFDFILQFLRTILLKHGASLVYTSSFDANSLQTLVHSSLGITSLLKRQMLKHNVIDRDKILVPANWDSWGKIRILREGFDMEGVGTAWSIEIQDAPGENKAKAGSQDSAEDNTQTPAEDSTSAVFAYEQTIPDPRRDTSASQANSANSTGIEIETLDNQNFLQSQVDIIEKLKVDDEKYNAERENKAQQARKTTELDTGSGLGSIDDQIGPIQFNMGGIQVDADDMLSRLKEREASRITPSNSSNTLSARRNPASPAALDAKSQNEEYASFFAGLAKRGGGGAASTPPPAA